MHVCEYVLSCMRVCAVLYVCECVQSCMCVKRTMATGERAVMLNKAVKRIARAFFGRVTVAEGPNLLTNQRPRNIAVSQKNAVNVP